MIIKYVLGTNVALEGNMNTVVAYGGSVKGNINKYPHLDILPSIADAYVW